MFSLSLRDVELILAERGTGPGAAVLVIARHDPLPLPPAAAPDERRSAPARPRRGLPGLGAGDLRPNGDVKLGAVGRPRPSLKAWILVVHPPRLTPSAWSRRPLCRPWRSGAPSRACCRAASPQPARPPQPASGTRPPRRPWRPGAIRPGRPRPARRRRWDRTPGLPWGGSARAPPPRAAARRDGSAAAHPNNLLHPYVANL